MSGAKLYVGDGATVARSMVRRIGGALLGHVPVRTQLTWCQTTGMARAIFAHCGAEIVEADAQTIQSKLQAMAKEQEVEARIA